MKRWLFSILIFVFGILLGWIISLTNVYPFYKTNLFWIGVLTSITLFFFFISISIFKLKDKSRQFQIASIFISLIFVGITSVSYNIYLLNNSYKEQSKSLQASIELQSKISLSNLEINKVENVAVLLKQISQELSDKEVRILSDSTINKIKSLSNSLTPFYYYDGNKLSSKELSPGRGQLLIGLCNLNIDSSSFNKVIQITNFSNSLLRNIDLSGRVLNRINLENADLSGTNLMGVTFIKSNLYKANLNNCNLSYSTLDSSLFKMASLKWADCSKSSMISTVFDGAHLEDSNFSESNLFNASLNWANLNGANFTNCNLRRTDLRWSRLTETNFENSIFTDSRIVNAIMNKTNFVNSNLDRLAVEKEWMDSLSLKNCIDYNHIHSKYEVIKDSSVYYKKLKYFLSLR